MADNELERSNLDQSMLHYKAMQYAKACYAGKSIN